MITPVLLKTYIALKEASSWLTVNDITEISENKPNTVSRQVRKLSKEKVLEVFEMHSGNYYRLSQDASDISVVQRLEASLTIIKI
ncbi:MAG TPA: hypothetical protein VE944_09840 [Nostoc sp.]|nr:hypothetical protein [Nostoc sp.]